MKLARYLITFLILAAPLSAGPIFFRECCGRQPCSFISWRGDCCVPRMHLYADFLYWQVHPDGLEFARSGGVAADSVSELTDQGEIITPGCGGKPGLRIGLELDLGPHCNWDAFAQYTYLSNTFSRSAKPDAASGAPLVPLVWNLGTPPLNGLNFAKGRWRHEINVLDLGMSHTFCVDKCFMFRPYLGLKATWQKLKYSVVYRYDQTTSVTSQDVACFTTDFNGIGLRGGLATRINVWGCMSFVGNFALSALYSDLNTHRLDQPIDDIFSGTSPRISNVWFNREHCTLVPVTEVFVGIQWDMPMMCGYDYYLLLGWEGQAWWNMTQYVLISNGTGINNYDFGQPGNVTYQGLVARLGVGF